MGKDIEYWLTTEGQKDMAQQIQEGFKDLFCFNCNNSCATCVCPECGAHFCITCFMSAYNNMCASCGAQTMY